MRSSQRGSQDQVTSVHVQCAGQWLSPAVLFRSSPLNNGTRHTDYRRHGVKNRKMVHSRLQVLVKLLGARWGEQGERMSEITFHELSYTRAGRRVSLICRLSFHLIFIGSKNKKKKDEMDEVCSTGPTICQRCV